MNGKDYAGNGFNYAGQPAEPINETGYEPTEPTDTTIHTPKQISEMTDRELLEELVVSMRTVGVALATLQKVGPMGMMKAVMTGNFPGSSK